MTVSGMYKASHDLNRQTVLRVILLPVVPQKVSTLCPIVRGFDRLETVGLLASGWYSYVHSWVACVQGVPVPVVHSQRVTNLGWKAGWPQTQYEAAIL